MIKNIFVFSHIPRGFTSLPPTLQELFDTILAANSDLPLPALDLGSEVSYTDGKKKL